MAEELQVREGVLLPPSNIFYKSYKAIDIATHWVDENGKYYKLSSCIKDVYRHCLDVYESLNNSGKKFRYTNKQISMNINNCSIDKVTRIAKPMLKLMGLMKGTHSNQKYFRLEKLKGQLFTCNHKDENTLPYLKETARLKNTLNDKEAISFIKRKNLIKETIKYLEKLKADPLGKDESLNHRGEGFKLKE